MINIKASHVWKPLVNLKVTKSCIVYIYIYIYMYIYYKSDNIAIQVFVISIYNKRVSRFLQ